MRRVHKWSTGFSSVACDGHSAQPAPTHSTRPMGGGAHAVRGHTSGQRLTGARPCRPTHRNQGNARRAHAAAFEGTLAALAALPSRAGGAVVRRRAYSTRLNASKDSLLIRDVHVPNWYQNMAAPVASRTVRCAPFCSASLVFKNLPFFAREKRYTAYVLVPYDP